MGAVHDDSIPENKGNNAVIERTNRHVLEGIRTLLNQAGLPIMYWPFAARYFCLACNTTAKHGAMTAWRKRFDEESAGVMYLFGCLVSYIPPKDGRVQWGKLGPKAIEGAYLGY